MIVDSNFKSQHESKINTPVQSGLCRETALRPQTALSLSEPSGLICQVVTVTCTLLTSQGWMCGTGPCTLHNAIQVPGLLAVAVTTVSLVITGHSQPGRD